MSIFVTQSLDQAVAVLVVARPGPVTDALESQLQDKGLAVVVVDPLALTPAVMTVLAEQLFYKICWLLDDTLKGSDAAEETYQFLVGRSEPLMVIVSSLGEEDIHPDWVRQRVSDQALVQHLQKYLKRADVLLLRNLLDLPVLFTSPLSFFSTANQAVHRLESGWFWREVVPEVVTRLLRPPQLLVAELKRSRRLQPSQLACWFAPVGSTAPATSPVTPPPTALTAHPFSSPDLSLTTMVTTRVERLTVVSEDLPDRGPSHPVSPVSSSGVWQQVAAAAHPQQQQFERHLDVERLGESIIRDQPIQIASPVIPKIPNRQRLYEHNVDRIRQRYQKQQLLRPVSARAKQAKHFSAALPVVPVTELKPLEKSLEVTIQQLFGLQRSEQRQDRLQRQVLKTARVKQRQVRQRRVIRFLSVLVIVAAVVAALVGSFFWLRQQLFGLIVAHADSAHLADQQVWQSRRTQWLVKAVATEAQLSQLIFGPDSAADTVAVASAVQQLRTVQQQRQEMQQLQEQIVQLVVGKRNGDVFQAINNLGAQQQSFYSSLSVIQTQLQALDTEFMADQERLAIEKMLNEVQQARRQVATFDQLSQLLPAFLGQQERRRVALVLLDSQELRPAGGLILGVYLLTLEKGQVIDRQFYLPAQLEADKTATIPAPSDYQKYLNQDQIQVIDAGWGADFTETAGTVNTLLDQQLGRRADLTVAVTAQFLQQVVAQTGPVIIAQTNETLTEKNFFERLELHPEQAYLQAVFTTLLDRLLEQPAQLNQVLPVFAAALQDGQLYLVSAQPTENEVLNSLGWAGQISTPQCPSLLATQNCQVSTIYQVESSIGLNKVGSLIRRSIEHTIELRPTEVRHRRLISFTNTANSTRWPLGAYQNYLRFYLPSGIEVTNVQVGERVLDLKTLDRGETKSGQFVGFLVNVPIKSTVDVVFEYRQVGSLVSDTGFAFFDQKQAGTPPDDYRLVMTPRDGLQIGVVAPKAEFVDGQLIFALQRQKHQFVGVKFR